MVQKRLDGLRGCKDNETNIQDIKVALEAAVHRQLMSDVPYGVLLSGGLDSSITSAVAKKICTKRIESDDTTDAWYHYIPFQ
jgi:asparagine synthase (glutamine-hydrolysing)